MGTASSKLEKKGSKVKGRLELIGKRENESVMAVYDHTEKLNEKYGVDVNIPNAALFTNVPNAAMAEQIAAGWPPWLAEAASEAIRGWIPRSPESFNKMDKVLLLCSCLCIRSKYLQLNCFFKFSRLHCSYGWSIFKT